MNYYTHCVSDTRWLGNAFFDLKGESITVDLQCLNNEWSTYLVDDLGDKETLDKIALQFFAECTRYVESSLALVLFEPNFLNSHDLKEPEKDEYTIKGPFCLKHYNIRSKSDSLKVRCVIEVGQNLFYAFNEDSGGPGLHIIFYNLLQVATIIKKYKDEFKIIISGNKDKIAKIKTIFSSIPDTELIEFLNSLIKK